MCGIFSGMKSHSGSDQIIEALGSKVIEALGAAVARTRLDLERYRTALPDIVATSSPRGLANWFHDRAWHHVVTELQDRDDVVVVDKGPVRELVVNGTYRIRIKRHDTKGRVSTYPTQTAREFLGQPPEQLVLDGLAEVHLMAGYQWDSTTHTIGPPVLSARDGLDNLLWMVDLPEPTEDGAIAPITDPTTPAPPTIEFPSEFAGERKAHD